MPNPPLTTERAERLAPETRQWLLGLARQAVVAALSGAERPEPASRPAQVDEKQGCFVTLHRRSGELRGCIGTFEAEAPLWHHVVSMAIAAATGDPRFPSVTASELEQCVFEISVLTPRRRATVEAIVVGRHGLWISRDGHRGVLLPQVATEYGWDRATFLEHACLKAGLPRNAWHDPTTRIEVFEAEVFGES